MSNIDIKVPNIGEFKDVEVIEVLIKKGQKIKKNDPLITIESDKSSVEIPSSDDGTVTSLKVKIGDKVSEGDKIIEIESEKEVKKTSVQELTKNQLSKKIKKNELKKSNETKNIIIKDFSAKASASPKVRKFARELGVNINKVPGSERQGRVTESDVKLFVATKSNKNFKDQNTTEKKIELEYSHSDFGEVDIKDIPRVKKLSSKYLMNSWTKIPHVTNHDEADITEMESFRISLKDIYTGERKKITPLAFITKAVVSTMKKFPNFNVSLDEIENGKMTVKKYFHIGIAVDTEHGLMVPKIRNVDKKNINEISDELRIVSDQCRKLKVDKKEFFGGSMTITSLGGIGGSFFTPIINYPEVAILGIGKLSKKQVYTGDKFETRIMLPLSLSYDHRIIDGAEAARFNNELKENLGKNFAYRLAL